jgi:Phosphoenolpyruvate phosphomutase
MSIRLFRLFIWHYCSIKCLSAFTTINSHLSHELTIHQKNCPNRSILFVKIKGDASNEPIFSPSSTSTLSLLRSCPAPARLRMILERIAKSNDEILLLPCCYDGLTARLVARGGFQATFMTGFGVSAVNGYPDTQLVSYNEMVAAANTVSEALSSIALERNQTPIPCIAVRSLLLIFY